MSKPIDEQTLLPDNRTSFERSFEEGFKKLVKSTDVLAAIADPCTTSKEILPIIASERGVNDWFFSDTEKQKRAITKVSYSVHQTSGTNAGIELALEAVDFSAKIEHWTKVQGGLPYTVYVTARANTTQMSPKERAHRLIERLNHVKSERDTVDLTLAYDVEQKFTAQAAVLPRVNIQPTKAQVKLWPISTSGRVSLGACGGAPISVSPMLVKAKLAQTKLTGNDYLGSALGLHPLSVSPIYTTARMP